MLQKLLGKGNWFFLICAFFKKANRVGHFKFVFIIFFFQPAQEGIISTCSCTLLVGKRALAVLPNRINVKPAEKVLYPGGHMPEDLFYFVG